MNQEDRVSRQSSSWLYGHQRTRPRGSVACVEVKSRDVVQQRFICAPI